MFILRGTVCEVKVIFFKCKTILILLLLCINSLAIADTLSDYGCDLREEQRDLAPSELIKKFTDDPKEGLGYIDNLRGFGGCDFRLRGEIITITNGNEGSKYAVEIKVNEVGNSLVEILEPSFEKGRKILRIESDIWLYLPNNRNTIRIAPLQRVFGGASISDVLSGAYNLHYDADEPIVAVCEARPCYKIESTIKQGLAGMHSIIFYLDKKNLSLISSEHFSKSGRLLQTVSYYDTSLFYSQEKILKMKIINNIKKKDVTWIRFSNYTPKVYPEKIFNKSNLGKI